MSHLIKELCTLTGTKKSRTTPSVINPKAKSMGNFGCLPNIKKYGDWFVELWRVQLYA
jgi:hypothetical protein